MNLMTPEILEHLKLLIAEDRVKEFYWTKEWRLIRKVRRRKDSNECQRCKRDGRYSPAEMVHHKNEVRYHPEQALDLDNIECLCNSCHNKEHPEKLHGYKKKKFDNEERW
ncbi:TPA: HNH endonuclease [Streptococcus pyogenes]|uniref:HNH endonuclease signature motif containing protein n=2 Tax=Streptococcus pyogenes TaxID=1314 RepID=UPI000D8396DF|nr:HNH endonuclease signature motif containing protein [Streptococcus pyogenes]QBX19200.1 homing endonuclease [Streptococcus phage Javan471]SQB67305.1 HNH endonuclease [Streptococcus dysgalactiae]QCK31473.1 HNH endonuclease [Streptococcus pyogenes]VGQ98836.1 HNH endonuclease [Streptococcus pyogenes]VGR01046.1 HNH endonuclease [Streptococcus pyogenes]